MSRAAADDDVKCSSLLSPFLATIQTSDKDGHRFISRPGLHLPILRLRFLAAFTLEHITASLLIAL